MSYILDALRRSDSERERGSVPSIHAQPVPRLSGDVKPSYHVKPWVWIATGLSAGLLVALGSIWMGREAPRQLDVAAGPVSAPPVQAPMQPPAQTPVQPPAAAPAAPSPVAAAAPPAVPAPPRARAVPASPLDPATTTPRKSASTAPTAAPTTIAKAAAPPPKAPASAPAPEGRIYTQGELPEDIRRQLPAMTIGGSIYSAHAANRMLIVNGQLLHEGDKLAPDLTLEQIKLKTAVLRFKGYRYEIGY